MKNHWKSLAILPLIAVILAGCSLFQSSGGEEDPSSQTVFIQNKGSDTMVNMALYWAETYQQIQPQVSVSVTGGGSGTGISALLTNTVDIANASRRITADEIQAAGAGGVQPQEFVVARDAIAIIVNPHNPVQELSLQQISDIYTGKISNWLELGGEDRPIVKLSRETNSGTHVYFLESVIRLGNSADKTIFSADTLLLPSSEGIIAEVRDNPNAIGYDGLGYVTPEVKVIAIRSTNGETVMPNIETVNQNLYPISRDLYMYTTGASNEFVSEYIQWILSPAGQQIVQDLGFVPVLTALEAGS